LNIAFFGELSNFLSYSLALALLLYLFQTDVTAY
jgi:hypothetical protein